MRDIRRTIRLGFLLVLLGLIAAAVSGSASGGATAASGNGPDPALVQKLKDKARGSVALSEKQATKHIGFVRAGQNGDLLPGNSGKAEVKAKDFLREYGAILGAGSESTLDEISSTTDSLGATHVTYQQFYKDVPVWAATIKAHTDADGNLTAVNGVAVPDISLDTTPRLSAADAGARAIATVVADPPANEQTGKPASLSASDLHVSSAKLYVYRLGLPKGAEGTNQLVYEVTVTNGSSVRDVVFVHADAGKVVNRYSTTTDAIDRKLYEQSPNTPPIWQEGDPFPGALNGDQQNLVTFSGNSYYHFFNAFGRDSFDGLGSTMKTVNNDPTISCPNANWNGMTTNYCNGVTSDDVVAHEWGHAYTQFTHDLIYQWQPGALNESYSDIWGETVDLINGLGTDAPATVRTVGACSTHTPEIPVVVINSPASIARICAAGTAAFGPPITSSFTVTGDIALANDGIAPGSDACTPLPAGSLAGKVGLVDRGTCGFVVKAKMAQDAGAIAVVVANNVGTGVNGMAGVDPTVVIPSLMISLPNGNAIKSVLPGTVNVTLRVRGGGSPPEDSYRWLMGEDSTAFGGAIRDMWTPTCLADPGKVSDAEYHCDTTDGGGVHTNSGVPNHGYALLVDGGTYNGQTVAGIGLTKAAHLYWRAQSVYQTKTTDFEDHADALEASCTDLIGQSLKALGTSSTPTGSSGQSIAAADCASVSAMIAAVELRTAPTQCNFQPALQQNPPNLCANQKNAPVIYEEDFEDGLGGWTLTNQGVFSGWAPPTDWVHDTSLPGGRSGSAAFAEDRDGSCDGGAGDRSGVMRLASPAITLPNAAVLNAPRLTFEHYFATEFGFDGGNVKISINGGAYALVPASAFIFNPYNATMPTAAQGNTSPLAGQPGFTGTDGGEVHGSWAQSQVDLSKLGVKAGDTIQLRFEFGMDGCGAIDGWYVDDFKIRACNTKKNPQAQNVTAKQD